MSLDKIMSLEIEYKNRTNGHGHFFDDDTMRFFKSRIGLVRIKDGIFYFVTSEKPPHGERRWSVRQMALDGDIATVGEFCSMSRYQANKLVNELAS